MTREHSACTSPTGPFELAGESGLSDKIQPRPTNNYT